MVTNLFLALVIMLPLDIRVHVDRVKVTVPVDNMDYDITDFENGRKVIIDVYGYPGIKTGLWKVKDDGIEEVEIKRFRTEKITRIIITATGPVKVLQKTKEGADLNVLLGIDTEDKAQPPRYVIRKIREKIVYNPSVKVDSIWFKFDNITTKDLLDFLSFVTGKEYKMMGRANRIHSLQGRAENFEEIIRRVQNEQ